MTNFFCRRNILLISYRIYENLKKKKIGRMYLCKNVFEAAQSNPKIYMKRIPFFAIYRIHYLLSTIITQKMR